MLGFISKFNGSVNTASPSRNNLSTNYTNFKGLNQPKSDTFVKDCSTEPIKANNNLSFKGGFKIPIEEITNFHKEYLDSLENLSKKQIVDDFCQTYSIGLRKITGKHQPGTKNPGRKKFYDDYEHELFGSFIQEQQLKLILLPAEATKEQAIEPMKQIVKHTDSAINRYQYFIDHRLNDPTKKISANKVWKLVKESLDQKIKEKNITLNIENEDLIKDPSLSTHYGYKNYTIMANLLENAAKYSPNNSEIKATFKVQDGNVHLIVKDRGRGIPPTEQEDILTSGARGSNVQDISGTGHGLFRTSKILQEVGLDTPKITSPLYPEEPINKGTQIEVPLIHDKN